MAGGLLIGKIFQTLHIPGFIAQGEYRNPNTNLIAFKIKISSRYTIIVLANNQEFYFLRESGRFDGTGDFNARGDI